MPKRDYDPLALIPSASTIRVKIAELQEQIRRLNILLRTAEEIEQGTSAEESTDARKAPQVE